MARIADITIFCVTKTHVHINDNDDYYTVFVNTNDGLIELSFNTIKDETLKEALRTLPKCNCIGDPISE